jgi:NAD(P)H-dependent FMN reductase
MNLKIAVISASPRQESLTIRAARFLKAELEKNTTHEVSLIDLRDWNTGYLQNVWETEEKTPEKFRPLYRTLNQSRAFILVTPEYNGMFSPAMNMVLDQFPKSNCNGIYRSFGRYAGCFTPAAIYSWFVWNPITANADDRTN